MGETNYLILLAADTYDVPHKSRDDEFQADAGDTVYRYFVCAVCPVKAPTLELRYDHDLNEFHPGLHRPYRAGPGAWLPVPRL